MAVALMHSMQVEGTRDAAQEAGAFARQLHDSWAVGHAACNDGVLLLLAVVERQVGAPPSLPGRRAAAPCAEHPASFPI